MKSKLIILVIISLFGLLINYQEKTGYFLKIFPQIKEPSLAFISLSRDGNKNFFGGERIWGWSFSYWEKNEFNFKSLLLNLIFYLVIWSIFLSLVWFIKGVINLSKKRPKAPPFKL